MLTIQALAKINLTLEVLGKRPDGYHEIRSIIQAVSLCDTLRFSQAEQVTITCDISGWTSEKSLISKAVKLLQTTNAHQGGVRIEVSKRIPLVSGLGGDSSDAAAVLRGLSQLWKLDLSDGKLAELAARLGSDVPFFIYGGTALAEGRGELLTRLPPCPPMWVLLVIPDVPKLPDKTKQLYASLSPGHYTDGRITQKLAEVIEQGKEIAPSLLFNTFENVAFSSFSQLAVYRDHLLKLGADDVHLAGSGPTLFSLIKDKAKAEDLRVRCQSQKIETYLVETLPGD